MHKSLYIEPVSTKNLEFTSLINQHLDHNEIVVTLIRYANHGGSKDYFVITQPEDFANLLNKLKAKTSITVFFENAFACKGPADINLNKKAIELFHAEYEAYEGIDIIYLEGARSHQPDPFEFLTTVEEINRWFQENQGAQILIGTMNFWQDNNERVLTAYEPDADGDIRSGAY